MADDILKNISLPADLPENWTSEQTVAPTGEEVGLDKQHGYNYLMKQVNNAQKAATALNEGKLGLHDAADNGVVASGDNYVRLGNGTQICWGESAAFQEIAAGAVVNTICTFAVPFFNSDYSCTTTFGADGGNSWNLRVSSTIRGTSDLQIFIGSRDLVVNAGTTIRYIAIGRWK
nr:MAG TPA: putative tail fiber protein [Caudoviricetes sp.]